MQTMFLVLNVFCFDCVIFFLLIYFVISYLFFRFSIPSFCFWFSLSLWKQLEYFVYLKKKHLWQKMKSGLCGKTNSKCLTFIFNLMLLLSATTKIFFVNIRLAWYRKSGATARIVKVGMVNIYLKFYNTIQSWVGGSKGLSNHSESKVSLLLLTQWS